MASTDSLGEGPAAALCKGILRLPGGLRGTGAERMQTQRTNPVICLWFLSHFPRSLHLPPTESFLFAQSRRCGVGRGRKEGPLLRKAAAVTLLTGPFPLPRKLVALSTGWGNSGEPEGVFSLEVYQDPYMLPRPRASLLSQLTVALAWFVRMTSWHLPGACFRLTSVQAPNILILKREILSYNTETDHLGGLCCIVQG